MPTKCKGKPPHFVNLGLGLSGIDFLLKWKENVEKLFVTVFDESGNNFFLLEALLLIKDKQLIPVSGYGTCFQMENITFSFYSSSIKSLDFEKNIIYHGGGQLSYDFLLIVNEFDLRIIFNNESHFSKQGFLNKTYPIDYKGGDEKKVVIEGHGLATISIALKLLDLGLTPIIVCRNSRLAIGEIPAEEAWLFGKQFKNKGMDLNFESRLELLPSVDTNDLIGVKVNNGKVFRVINVIVVDDNTPYGSYGLLKNIYSGTKLKTKINHCVLGYSNIYAVGDNNSVVTERVWEAENFTTLKEKAKKSKNKYRYCSNNYFVFMGISWQTYGEISPIWGDDTQNFYWEHPGGDVSFRLQYRKNDFTIKGIACSGISFNKSFMSNALQSNWKAHDFIDRIDEGYVQNEFPSDICSLIKKSFAVEFKKIIKPYRPSLFSRFFKKLF